jgi:predicted TIM-barrel fold metal-dependent hydrolase
VARRSDTAGGSPIVAIVGHADLRHGAEAGRALDALQLAGDGRFVGIRHATAWDADPTIPNHRTDPVDGLMDSETWRAGFAELAKRDLTYDAWLYHPQIPELVRLARDFPEVQMVCDHLGGPLGIGVYAGQRDEILAATQASLRELAACPNVALKLGGIGMATMGDGWHRRDRPPSSTDLADTWGPFIRSCIEIFGADRCLFESNFPVDRMSCSYVVLWNAFKRMVPDVSDGERASLFSETARRVYRIPT